VSKLIQAAQKPGAQKPIQRTGAEVSALPAEEMNTAKIPRGSTTDNKSSVLSGTKLRRDLTLDRPESSTKGGAKERSRAPARDRRACRKEKQSEDSTGALPGKLAVERIRHEADNRQPLGIWTKRTESTKGQTGSG
jgi:hypothetical protein